MLTVTANVHAPLDGTPPSFKIQGVLSAFKLDLFDVIAVSFGGLSFTAESGRKADVTAGAVKVAFEGPLSFVNDLTKVIPEVDSATRPTWMWHPTTSKRDSR